MKKNLLYIFSVSLIAAMLSVMSFAQDSRVVSAAGDKYVISAKAGGVNYVEGRVNITRKAGKSGYLLKGDEVEIGDIIATGSEGKAEILLNPGSYIRLAENSQFEFLSTSLDDLKLKVVRGSAMLEVFADDEFAVAVITPTARFLAVKTGVYRIDVTANGSSTISVWKGEARIGDEDSTKVKKGRTATISGSRVSIEKFDRDEKDSFEIWSKDRSKELAKINSRLQRNGLRNTLLTSFNNGRWNMYNSFGLWVYDPLRGMWCFLPFGYGWSSPYGYGYGFDIWDCRLPRAVYTQPPPPSSIGGGGNTTTGSPGTPADRTDINEERRRRVITPPFQRVDKTDRGRDSGFDGGFPSERKLDPTRIESTPVRTSPPSSNPVSTPETRPIRPGKDN